MGIRHSNLIRPPAHVDGIPGWPKATDPHQDNKMPICVQCGEYAWGSATTVENISFCDACLADSFWYSCATCKEQVCYAKHCDDTTWIQKATIVKDDDEHFHAIPDDSEIILIECSKKHTTLVKFVSKCGCGWNSSKANPR